MKRTALARGTALARRTPLHRAALPARGRSKMPPSIPLAVRREVRARSGGRCEVCAQPAVHMHHRKLRSQGGRHEAVNLLHLCAACHEGVHANPGRSYSLGLIVPGWADPADVGVIRVEGLRL